jgi:Flp pilus assembly pilin Flp
VIHLFVRVQLWIGWIRARLRSESGQSTAEYALVILAAAAIALVLLAWARSSGKLPAFFDSIIDRIVGQSE